MQNYQGSAGLQDGSLRMPWDVCAHSVPGPVVHSAQDRVSLQRYFPSLKRSNVFITEVTYIYCVTFGKCKKV